MTLRNTLPVLLVQDEMLAYDATAALRESDRVQLVNAAEVRGSPTAFSLRVARATIVVTRRPPLDELVRIRGTGYTGPLVMAIDGKYARLRSSLVQGGALATLLLPVDAAELDQVIGMIERLPAPAISFQRMGIVLDPIDHTARFGGAIAHLSPREFSLMHCLVRNGGRAVPVDELLNYVWGMPRDAGGAIDSLNVYVSHLRKKLKPIGLGDAIRTYRGFGYGLSAGEDAE
jgi:DNA-binding response OmpR family regulator